MTSSLSALRSTARALARRPAFTLVVVASLAVGIGANTAIFSLVNGVLLQPLPYPEPDRLVTVWEDHTRRDGPVDEWTGYSTFRDWRDGSTVFDSLAAYSGWGPNLGDGADGGEPEQLAGLAVTHGWFRVLGVAPSRGRGFEASDDLPGAEAVALVGHGLWQRRFGGDPAILGSAISLDDRPVTVVGILPAGFEPLIPGTEIWRPLARDPAVDDRGGYFLQVVGRLKSEVGPESAQADLDRVAAAVAAEVPAHYQDVGITLIPLHERMVGAAEPALFALAGAVGLLLLVTCANVANLLLVRTVGRRQELAIRAGLGAGRGRLAGRLLGESLLLAGAGGLAGCGLAHGGTRLLVSLAPPGTPRIAEVSLDATVAAFAVGLSLATGFAFGVLPALLGSRLDLATVLRPGGRVESAGQGRLRAGLVVAEVALALCLLVGAGLLAKSFWGLTRVDVGFEPEGIVTASIQLPDARYPEREDRVRLVAQLTRALDDRPEIESAAAVSNLPMAGPGSDFSYYVEGAPPAPEGRRPSAWYRMVTPAYFDTLGISIVEGQPFDASHHLGDPPVIAVSERFARRWFGDESPIGKRMKPGGHDSEREWMTIVAVVSDVRDRSPMLPTRDDVYLHHAQWGNRAMSLTLASPAGLEAAGVAITEELGRLDPALSATEPVPLEETVSGTLWLPRLAAQVLSVFAAASLALAALGIYGVLAYSVERRRRELGIRAALGADRTKLVGLVLSRGMALAGLGTATGAVLAAALSGLLRGLLHGVEPADPLVLSATAALLLAIAALASWLPAKRASAVDPAECLRQE